jgi:hypothetical protein
MALLTVTFTVRNGPHAALLTFSTHRVTIRGAEKWYALYLRSVSLGKEYDSHCASMSDVSRNSANHCLSNSFKEPPLDFVADAGLQYSMVTYDSSANVIAG